MFYFPFSLIQDVPFALHTSFKLFDISLTSKGNLSGVGICWKQRVRRRTLQKLPETPLRTLKATFSCPAAVRPRASETKNLRVKLKRKTKNT